MGPHRTEHRASWLHCLLPWKCLLCPTGYCFIDSHYDHSHCYWYMLFQCKRQEHPGRCEEDNRISKEGVVLPASCLDQPSSLPENVFYSQPGTVSLSFVKVNRIVIDIFYCIISAKSTLVGVRKKMGPQRREHGASWLHCLLPRKCLFFLTRYCSIDSHYDHSHCYWYLLLQYNRQEHPGRCDEEKLGELSVARGSSFSHWQPASPSSSI